MKSLILKIWRFVRTILLSVSLIVLLAFWGMRTEWFQNWATKRLEALLSSNLGTEVHIGGLDFDLPAKLVIRDFKMEDQAGQPMFAAGELRLAMATFSIIDLIRQPEDPEAIDIRRLDVLSPEVSIYKRRSDSLLNIDFLSTPSEDTLPAKPLNLAINALDINIQSGRFSYVDSTRSDSVLADRSKLNPANLEVAGIRSDLSFVLSPVLHMTGEIREFQAREERIFQQISRLEGNYIVDLGPDAPGGLAIHLDDGLLVLGPQTRLDFDATFANQRPDSLENGFFPTFQADFRPSTFEFAALNSFLSEPLPMQDPVSLSGSISGNMDRIHSDALKIGLYDETEIRTALDLKDFGSSDDLTMVLRMEPSDVTFEEVRRFLPGVEIPLAGKALIDGVIDFDLKSIYSKDLHIRYGEYTDLHVRTRLHEYSTADLLMDFRMEESKVDFQEVLQLLPGLELPDWLARFGRAQVEGRFLGGPQDFVVDAKAASDLGKVEGNLHLETPRGKPLEYEGSFKTQNLNLDAIGIVEGTEIKNLNFNGYVDGRGSAFGEMNTKVFGNISNSDLLGYRIDKLETSDTVKIVGQTVKGKIQLEDPEGNASVTLDLDLPEEGGHTYNVFGDVANLDLDHYGILPGDSILLTSILNLRLNGDSLENYEGKLRFFEIKLLRGGMDSLKLRNVRLTSEIDTLGERSLTLRSSLADMDLKGKFRFDDVAKVGSRLGEEINLYLRNNDSLISKYYAEKVLLQEEINIKDTLTTKAELSKLISFLDLPVYIEPGTVLMLELDHGLEDVLKVQLKSDSLNFSGVGIVDSDADLDLIKFGDRNELLLAGYFNAEGLWAAKNLYFEDFVLEPEGDDKELNVFLHFQQPEIGNSFRFRTKTKFLSNGEVQTRILPSNSLVNIKGREWRFSQGNQIVRKWMPPPSLSNPGDSLIDRFIVSNLSLSHAGQFISVDGVISSDPSDDLAVRLSKINIAEVLEITEQDISIGGFIDSAVFSVWNLLADQPIFYGEGEIDHFQYKTLDSLNIDFSGGWPYLGGPDYAGFYLGIERAGLDSLALSGTYKIPTDMLDIKAEPSRFPLAWFEPFLEGEVTHMKGKLYIPQLEVRGTTKQPRLVGEAYFDNAAMRVAYLNNVFQLGDSKLVFDQDAVYLKGLALRDTFGGSARLNGMVQYKQLDQARMEFGLNEIDDFTIMDTRKGMNPDFYGKVVLKGDTASVVGPFNRIQINAKVNTTKGTWLDLPLDNYTSASRLDFVQFVAGGKAIEVKEKQEITGIGMEVTVQANPDARVRLILNETAGDIIEARGSGAITMKITELGEFTMSGVYTLESGNYLFTAENIVNKQFVVRPGGTIFFNGDPYNAEMNLDAVYKVDADVSDLLPGQSGRVPVDIIMHMTGSLEEPNIKLELKIDELSQQDVMGLASYFRRIEYDEQELNKQVVSLLLFRRFSGTAVANNNTAGSGVTSSISELVSNQLNYWISQAFEDANLGLEVNTDNFQNVELAVRTTLFNDRVTVERNGAIISNQNQGVTLGDLSVQVKLLPKLDSNNVSLPGSGQLVMEIFNREDASLNAATNVTRGVGVFYKKDFDRIKDLFKRVGRKEKP